MYSTSEQVYTAANNLTECFMYYVRRKYYAHSVKPKRVRKQ